ncbi:site-specific integrase [Sulfoacidibacillus ferrooxidans]|uniref:Core-binding (CB) domain-containing protein n=1 Tax=Sulfoacidibacillus ferrooxidans TaxID=2005001 RepID=A0A9X1VAQ6_9BACL|nr:site-specific integrase [Sulfoacidibacillus ferrooxidans]MCI0184217.1 hypothetical protein [Sulfoacidibacillus ferrooxidans]
MDEQRQQVLKRLAEDIQLRGLSPNTLESYTTHAKIFLEFCGHQSIDQLNTEDIRRFLLQLIHEKKVSSGTVNVYSAASQRGRSSQNPAY